jgi:pantoate--beta-alanine ligase
VLFRSIILRKVSGVKVEYLAVCDAKTLEPLTRVKGQVVLLGAIQIGTIRLIDNLLVKKSL